MANGYPEVEDQEGTRIEKVLLAALVAFLLVGGFWALEQIETALPAPVLQSYGDSAYAPRTAGDSTVSVEDEVGVTKLRTEIQKFQVQSDKAGESLSSLLAAKGKAEETYKFRREEYRTAMQAGIASIAQRTAFEKSRATLQKADALIPTAQAASNLANQSLKSEQQKVDAAAKRAQDVYNTRSSLRNVKLFAAHFSFTAICLVLSWNLWQLGRKRRWRYQTILTGLFTASILQLFFLLFRYCWALFLADLATLGIATVGSGICIAAIIAIKRWLYSPERLALARLSARRCTHCATPFTDAQSHCWKCGNAIVEKCSSCGSNRLLYAPFCGTCGSGAQQTPQNFPAS